MEALVRGKNVGCREHEREVHPCLGLNIDPIAAGQQSFGTNLPLHPTKVLWYLVTNKSVTQNAAVSTRLG